jgi:pimeloyl-ACP methyl ester carboxylesterase
MPETDEARALARLAADELGGATGGIGNIHAAIAGRVFGALGGPARPVQAVHDAISRGVYASVRGGFGAAGLAAEAALRSREPGGPPVSETPRGAVALGVINGLRGDALQAESSALAAPMGVRVDGQIVPPEDVAQRTGATPRLVVFIHGLMETEHAWHPRTGASFGEGLARDDGWTALELRFNSGLHISENGRALAELLEQIVAAWPVEVERIALVGHSMGGLVARSGAYHATGQNMAWADRTSHVVSLGSPHMGAPLAQGVHHAAHAMHAVPELRPFAGLLRRRSAGIRDLRNGSLVDADWHGRDPDALRAAACAEVPLLPHATHCFVAATITRDAHHPLGRLLGDALVLQPSASGRSKSRRLGFRDDDGVHLGRVHHLALLRHPAVYARLRGWLAR